MPNHIASLDEILEQTTHDYLDALKLQPSMPDRITVRNDLYAMTRTAIEDHNTLLGRQSRVKVPTGLYPVQIAWCIQAIEPVCCIACTGNQTDSEYDVLAIYQDSGPDEGCYDTNELAMARLIREYNRTISSGGVTEVCNILKTIVPHRRRTQDRDLIAVNNGIFDYKNKCLMPFSPDYIFLAKCHVDYNPAATNPVIHNPDDGTDWDVESWLDELSDDQEVRILLRQVLGAVIRPFVHWNKSVWFYSTTGNNGKGTLCALMRNLCGPGSHTSIALSDFSKDFLLEPLIRSTAIITDENDVGAFIDKAANLKAIITNDVIQINRKFKQPIAYQYFGFMVQCLNEMPRIKDKSDSFYRRQIFVPFEKCFTGAERKYIKSDYLARNEVLEYVLRTVLESNYYELVEPQACRAAMAEYKDFNDPVRQFCEEILPLCVWDVLPFAFLFDLYVAWFRKNSPSGSVQGRNTFINDLVNLLPNYQEWACPDKKTPIHPGARMSKPEPLIREYNLTAWSNPACPDTKSPNWCVPCIKTSYRGIVRA